MTLVDRSPEMLALSNTLNPECEHIQGDMRSIRLGRYFDAVLIHDAIMYMTTEDELAMAIQTAFEHCAPGGAALFCPDHVRENFQATTAHGGHDSATRGARCLWWTWDPDPADTSYELAMAYILRDADRSMQMAGDVHRFGLFSRETWLALLRGVGFEARLIAGAGDREAFLGSRTRRCPEEFGHET
jgi:hypothetical protein